jgi:triphosphoribosyl-dephospho-CoA synthetase
MSSDIFKSIHFIGSYIKDDFKKEYDTFGYLAYQKYHFLGARGELMSGLMTIQHTLKVFPIDTDIDDMTLRKILVNIIMQTDDTVLLKRSKSLENYTNFKKELALLDLNDINAIKSFNQNAIINNLSVGGSADLLVTYLFIKAYFLHMNIK